MSCVFVALVDQCTGQWAKIIPEMEELVKHLRARGWRVVIVTASPKWVIEPGALRLGLGRDDVLGIEVSGTTPV